MVLVWVSGNVVIYFGTVRFWITVDVEKSVNNEEIGKLNFKNRNFWEFLLKKRWATISWKSFVYLLYFGGERGGDFVQFVPCSTEVSWNSIFSTRRFWFWCHPLSYLGNFPIPTGNISSGAVGLPFFLTFWNQNYRVTIFIFCHNNSLWNWEFIIFKCHENAIQMVQSK